MTRLRLVGIVGTGNLLMVLSGISVNWLIINIDRISNFYYKDMPVLSLLYFSLLIGQIIGSLIFSVLSDFIGRKFCLLFLSVLCIASLVISELALNTSILLFIARGIAGLFMGGTFAVLPIYVAELSDPNSRGALISSGLTAYLLGGIVVFILKYFNAGGLALCIIGVILAILFIPVFLWIGPESPFYFMKRGRLNTVKITLNKLRDYDANIESEITDMQRKNDENKYDVDPNEKLAARINLPGWIKALFMIIPVLFAQVLLIIGDLLYISSKLSDRIESRTEFLNGFLVLAELVGSCACIVLVDRLGRKLLLTISYGAVTVSAAMLLIMVAIIDNTNIIISSYVVVVPFAVLKICYGGAIAPIMFIYIGELFSLRIKMIASGVLTGFFFGLIYVFILLFFNSFAFYSSIVWSVFSIFFYIISAVIMNLFFLETKCKSLQQIQMSLNKKVLIQGHLISAGVSRPLIEQRNF